MYKESRISTLSIACKDGSKRIVRAIGLWTISMATSLAKDLEKENYKYVTVTH